ncbi:MAG: PqqD family protein [Acidobacteriota bacterium]
MLINREPGLEIEPAGDGFIVYDEGRERVHYLNHTAALVFELATGTRAAPDIARWIARAYGLAESPVADVETALEELVAEKLVTVSAADPSEAAAHAPQMDR